MFSDINKNLTIIEGAYRKFKSYYYYNKNFLCMRKKIADFESDPAIMLDTFNVLAKYLLHPNSKSSKILIDDLLCKINIIALPKKFEQPQAKQNAPVSNFVSKDKKLKDVNFFIDMPIELCIIDTVLCVCLGKVSNELMLLSFDVYGNTLNEKALFNEGEILWENNRLFNTYFNKYSQWRNEAFNCLERNYDKGKDSLLVSIDLKSYYYSARCSYKYFKNKFKDSSIYKNCRFLFKIYSQISIKYLSILKQFRHFEEAFKEDEFCLPIGMLSSMVLANIYLSDFDDKVIECNDLAYYGRYVDDMLFVFCTSLDPNDKVDNIIKDKLIKNSILLTKTSNESQLFNHPELIVQDEKVKLIYIDHSESRAILDVYNDTIKIVPSQTQPIPEWDFNFKDFEESVYSFEKFTQSSKIRDLGDISLDPYKIGRYFSHLVSKFINIDIDNFTKKQVENQIKKMNQFFSGGQAIEYYAHWQNYMYFLVITEKFDELKNFYGSIKNEIRNAVNYNLDNKKYKKIKSLNKIVKDSILAHLDICYFTAFSINLPVVPARRQSEVKKYINSNMFNHNLLMLPLSNYVFNDYDKALINLAVEDLKFESTNYSTNPKFKWSPRFIHFDELLMLYFYYQHNNERRQMGKFADSKLVEAFININHISYLPFTIEQRDIYKLSDELKYSLKQFIVPDDREKNINRINICTASINLSPEDCVKSLEKKNISSKKKEVIWKILDEAFKYSGTVKIDKLLILPELFYPTTLIKDLIKYSRITQTAIITGLGYIKVNDNQVKNYVATILPFKSKCYKNAMIFIREKNDYSPIEKHLLAKHGYTCVDNEISKYQIFNWRGLDLGAMICFELTDIMARALLRGNVDLLALPVLNKDTTYFSNIIDSATRDLHCVIVQANTASYGDTRVTAPYDRDNKDIFKIKGGDNGNTVIGTLDLDGLFKYQSNYYNNDSQYIKKLLKRKGKKTSKKLIDKNASSEKPNIKRLSARFRNKRTSR